MKKIILLLFAIVFTTSAFSQKTAQTDGNGINKPIFKRTQNVTTNQAVITSQYTVTKPKTLVNTRETEAEILADANWRATHSPNNSPSYTDLNTRGTKADFIPTAGATESFTPAVGDNFFDPGGPGGSTAGGSPGNYPNCGCDTVTTLDGVTEVDFLYFSVFSTFDYLIIYDGVDTTGPVLYNNGTGGANVNDKDLTDMIASNGSATFTATSGSMTFFFHSSTVVDYGGWDAEIIAIAGGSGNTCGQTQLTNAFENGFTITTSGTQRIADDFPVAADEDMTVETVVANIWTTPGINIGSSNLIFYSDGSGLPGASVTSATLLPISQTVVGNNFGFDVHECTYDITGSNIVLSGGALGTNYWLAIDAAPVSGPTSLYWDTSSAGPINGADAHFSGDSGATWNLLGGYNQVFTISGDCTASVITIPPTPTCTHQLEISDPDWSDGWNGGSISVFVNGAVVLNEVTLPTGAGPITFDFEASEGDEITADYTAGIFGDRDNYKIFDVNGNLLFESGFPNVPGDLVSPGVAGDCSIGEPPILSCPADVIADSEPGVCGAVVNFADASAIDPEDGGLTTTQTFGLPSGSVFPTGESYVGFSATDADGNTTSCYFMVTVNDIENPMAMCQDITVELDAAGIVSIMPEDIDNGSTDNCDFTLSLDISSFSCADVGENTVTLMVTDDSGLMDTCTATVTVEDNLAPSILCMGVAGGTFAVMEDFEAASIPADWTTVIESGSWDWTFGSGIMPGTTNFPTNAAIFDDDAAGSGAPNHARLLSPTYGLMGANAASLSFDYALGDFAGSGKLSVEVWDGGAWVEIFVADNADIPPTNTGVIDVLAYANAGFQVRFSYDDENGGWNWGAGVDNFVFDYDITPTPPLEVVLDANGLYTLDANELLFSVDDNCGYMASFGSGGGVSGSLTTLFATDNGGSPGGAVYFDVTVGPSDINVTSFDINTADAGAFTMDVYALVGTYIGNEGNAAAWGTPVNAAGTAAGVDMPSNAVLDTPVMLSAGMTYGMALVLDASHGHSYTNGDGSNENFSNADVAMSLGAASNVPFDGSAFSPRVFNGAIHYAAGGGATMDLDCSNLGENMIDVTVTDAGGNEAMCTAVVTVLDETAPVIICGPDPLLFGADMASDSPALAIPDADLVGVTTTIEVMDDFTLTDLNVDMNITHTWRGDLDITLTSPMGTTVVLKAANISDSAANWIVTWDDEGTPADEMLSAFDGESTMGTWTLFVADNFGGDTGTINSWGIVYEYSYPNPETDLFIELGPDGTVSLVPEDVLAVMEEACAIDVILLDITEFSCADIGTPTLVTVFANDTSGNFASCQIEVNIVDRMEPMLTCPADTTAAFDPATGTYVLPDYFAIGDAFATDNCTDVSMLVVTQDPAPGTQLGVNSYVITFTAEDENGNIATCSMNLDVATIGVNDNLLENALSMYPNPATDLVKLVNTSDIALEAAMIYDLNGKLVAEFDLEDMQRETTLDISNFASGVFMVKIIGENASTVKRLIKE